MHSPPSATNDPHRSMSFRAWGRGCHLFAIRWFIFAGSLRLVRCLGSPLFSFCSMSLLWFNPFLLLCLLLLGAREQSDVGPGLGGLPELGNGSSWGHRAAASSAPGAVCSDLPMAQTRNNSALDLWSKASPGRGDSGDRQDAQERPSHEAQCSNLSAASHQHKPGSTFRPDRQTDTVATCLNAPWSKGGCRPGEGSTCGGKGMPAAPGQ